MGQFTQGDFKGVSPVLYAFWDEREALDHSLMKLQVERCLAAGAHGVTVLGLVTEINKMDVNERLDLVQVVGRAVAGRVPYSVTIGEPSVPGQIAFAKASADAGADWIILQPPTVKGVSEAAILDFFKRVADASPLPVAIQNNPVNLDVWLTNDALADLAAGHERITLIKGEGSAVGVAALCERLGPDVAVFAGHGGVEYPLNISGGCVGLIPAPELLDRQVRIHDGLTSEDANARDDAMRMHAEILPWIVMMTRAGVEGMLCYGKQLMARRLGVPEPISRRPHATANRAGEAEVDRMAALLGPL